MSPSVELLARMFDLVGWNLMSEMVRIEMSHKLSCYNYHQLTRHFLLMRLKESTHISALSYIVEHEINLVIELIAARTYVMIIRIDIEAIYRLYDHFSIVLKRVYSRETPQIVQMNLTGYRRYQKHVLIVFEKSQRRHVVIELAEIILAKIFTQPSRRHVINLHLIVETDSDLREITGIGGELDVFSFERCRLLVSLDEVEWEEFADVIDGVAVFDWIQLWLAVERCVKVDGHCWC